MGQINFLVTIALISIFALAIFNMAVGFGNDVGGKINIDDAAEWGGSNTTIVTNADQSFAVANASSTSFALSNIKENIELSVSGTEFKSADKSDASSVYSTIDNARKSIFGSVDSSFNGVFTIIKALIMTIILMLAYKTWIGKNPE